MLNKATLRFSAQNLELHYQEQQKETVVYYFAAFTIFSIVCSIQIIKTISSCYYFNLYTIILASTLFIPLAPISCYIVYKRYRVINIMLLAYQIFIFFLSDAIYLLYQPILWDNWLPAYCSCLWHITLYFQGTNFLLNTMSLVISSILQIIWTKNYIVFYFAYCQMIIVIILIRWVLEKNKRLNYLSLLQNEKWNKIIEEVLPTWIVILKYDYQDRVLVMEKANKYFRKYFNITHNKDLRRQIRKLRIFRESSILENMKPVMKDEVKYENHLISLLTSHHNQNTEVERFFAFQMTDKQRVFKISQVLFQSIEPMVLLNIEEIIENKCQELEEAIKFRDKMVYSYCKQTLLKCGENIEFLKFMLSSVEKWILKEQLHKKIQRIIQQKIFSQYFIFNDLMTLHSLLQINYNCFTYQCDLISLEKLQKQLCEDLFLRQRNPKRKLCTQKSFLRRQISKLSSDVPQNSIKNDRSKFVQIIISMVQFIKYFIGEKENENLENELIQISIKPNKKNPEHVAIRLFHANLDVPEEIIKILNRNWSGSDHNKKRWGYKQHFETIQLVYEKFQQLNHHEQTNQNIKNFLFSGLPTAQYLLGQLGPYGFFLFKNKKIDDQATSRINQIKFFVFINISDVIEQLNSDVPNPQYMLYLKPEDFKNQDTNLNDTDRFQSYKSQKVLGRQNSKLQLLTENNTAKLRKMSIFSFKEQQN